jgi:hypothetical protein
MHINRSISDHGHGTCITIRSGYSNSKSFKRLIWDYKKWERDMRKPPSSRVHLKRRRGSQ